MAKTSLSLISLLPTTLLLLIIPTTKSQNSDSFYYDLCAPFVCGNINFSFPFSSSETFGSRRFDCGLPRFQISCDNITSLPGLELSGRLYRIKDVYTSENLITIVDHQLIGDLRTNSCGSLQNITISTVIDGGPFLRLPSWDTNFSFFKCPHGIELNSSTRVVGNYSCREGNWVYLWEDESWNLTRLVPPRGRPVETPGGCQLVTLPVFRASLSRYGFLNGSGGRGGSGDRQMKLVFEVLSDGFPLEWLTIEDCTTCNQTGGRCGYDSSSGRILIGDLRTNSCGSLQNITISTVIDGGPFLRLPSWDTNFSFFKCPHGIELNSSTRVVGNYSCREGNWVYLWEDESWNLTRLVPPRGRPVETPGGCQLVTLPVFRASLSRYGFLNGSGGRGGSGDRQMKLVFEVLSDGFPLEWLTIEDCTTCNQTGGRCGYDSSSRRIVCFCKGGCK
ncbi:unnamed protein product [Ilex paraguariensis]|uniref:non-specific serine/threonine protein kinase n=1 Tax=Ilex paraguariensis TaxID=185542 RepID=A0ABC8SQL2_9AQUA